MIPIGVLRDTIQPFPSFSEVIATVLKALDREIKAGTESTGTRSVPAGSVSK
jgi:dihydrolipoamide dehydrogenase